MSTLKEALDAASKAAYGDGWEELHPTAKDVVRERTLPLVNIVLVHVREAIARQLDHRAEMQAGNHHIEASKQLVYAAREARRWPAAAGNGVAS
jgi:hypothetical protein